MKKLSKEQKKSLRKFIFAVYDIIYTFLFIGYVLLGFFAYGMTVYLWIGGLLVISMYAWARYLELKQ
jgi:small neutral amino acid transporter SnatA (MarC family)